MEVKDPTTGQMVTVPMRRDLPGYNVTRARKSPRMRWSLPVDIQWQSECIMKFLGQSCACCDVLTGGPNKENELKATQKTTNEQLTTRQRPRGLDTILVDSSSQGSKKSEGKTEITSTTTTVDYSYKLPATLEALAGSSAVTSSSLSTRDVNAGNAVSERLSLQGLDMFPGFPIPSKSPGMRQKNRRRRQLISTTEMLVPQSAPINSVSAPQTPFDIMKSQVAKSDVIAEENSENVTSDNPGTAQAQLPDIVEEDNTDKV